MHVLHRQRRKRIRTSCGEKSMDAKGYLEEYKLMQTRLNVLQAEIERLRAEAESVSINLDGMPKGGQTGDKTARLAVQIADMESTWKQELSWLWSRRMKIISQLGELKNHRHQTLLHKRYIENETWEAIAYEMDLSWRHTYRLHGSALAEFEKILNR